MTNILDMLFIKNILIDKSKFNALYFSSDNYSFSGFNDDIFIINKNYESYNIIESMESLIGEKHHEYKYIINALGDKFFIRILSDDRNLIYDILIYSLKDNYELINKVFFTKKDVLPDIIIKSTKPIIKIDNGVKLIKNHKEFVKYLGYQDWDYENKCQNRLDYSTNDNIINDFKGISFINKYLFKKNDGALIDLLLKFDYCDGYYIITEIKEM